MKTLEKYKTYSLTKFNINFYRIEIVYMVSHRSIARQQLGKYIPAGANARNNRTSIARQ
jgi:hypothetical protein